MREALLAVVLVTAGLAGCIGAGETSTDPAGTASADEARTLDAPPDLQVGEWWTVQVEGQQSFDTFETTIVVADRTDETLTVGVPEGDFTDAMQIIHLPPLGSVDRGTLSWHVMYDRFQPARFPLEAGDEWTTQFHGNDVTARVASAADGEAVVKMTGQNERITVTYDAEMGMVTSFQPDSYPVSFEVVDHGFDYEGTVVSPTDKALGFLKFRAGPVNGSLEPAAPVETVELDRDVSHASLALLAGSLTPTGHNAGIYRAKVTAPDGTAFEKTFTGAGSTGIMADFHGHDTVPGTWELEFETGGPGVVGSELITYDRAEVTLGGSGGSTAGASP